MGVRYLFRNVVFEVGNAILDVENKLLADGLPDDATILRFVKSMGFSDARLAELTQLEAADVRQRRTAAGVVPAVCSRLWRPKNIEQPMKNR